MLLDISTVDQRHSSQDSQITESTQSPSDNSRLPNYSAKTSTSATNQGAIERYLGAIVTEVDWKDFRHLRRCSPESYQATLTALSGYLATEMMTYLDAIVGGDGHV